MDKYNEYNSSINAYCQLPEFDGLTFKVDSFVEKNLDSVFPILFEEQPITWLLFKEKIAKVLGNGENKSVLDAGCGSGFWALMFKKNFSHCSVSGIDKNEKAIAYLAENAQRNNIEGIQEIHGEYCRESYEAASFDVIVLIPPYHLYSDGSAHNIPLFAKGGKNGWEEFYKQLETSQHHLNDNGMIVFNQMCLGSEDVPAYVEKIEELFPKGALEYYNIIEPHASKEFLDPLYPDDKISIEVKEWKDNLKNRFPKLFYTSGVIYKQSPHNKFTATSTMCDWNNGEIEKLIKQHPSFKRRPLWKDRIKLHKDINAFG